jgi:hypothetical protein
MALRAALRNPSSPPFFKEKRAWKKGREGRLYGFTKEQTVTIDTGRIRALYTFHVAS